MLRRSFGMLVFPAGFVVRSMVCVFLPLLLLVLPHISVAQPVYTFSNTTANAHNTWDSGNNFTTALTKAISVSGLPTSGLVLRQVNLFMGSNTNSNFTTLRMRLTDPSGNAVDLINSGYFYDTSFGQYISIQLRDHSSLLRVRDYASPWLGMPYSFGYYRVETQGSFANFNTTTGVNGNWTIRIIENTTTEPAFEKVELVFGPPFTYINITGSNNNRQCAAAQCLQSGNNEIIIGTNVSYPQGQTVYPPLNVGGCNWNSARNNTAWFFFTASQPNVNVSASGFTSIQQTVVFRINGSCASPSYELIGCPWSLWAGNCTNTSGNPTLYHRSCYADGSRWNQAYELSGLTVGANYLFIIDGQGASANSNFYLELSSGGDDGCNFVLPVNFLGMDISCNKGTSELTWSTASERDNAYFTVYRDDGSGWYTAGNVAGAGDTQRTTQYAWTDPRPSSSTTSYKLDQTDHSGASEELHRITGRCAPAKDELIIHPNPASGRAVVKSASNIEEVHVYDATGRLVHSTTVGDLRAELHLEHLPLGTYTTLVVLEGRQVVHKLMLVP
jgi:hypothetical protein